jgi:hypothetical protein
MESSHADINQANAIVTSVIELDTPTFRQQSAMSADYGEKLLLLRGHVNIFRDKDGRYQGGHESQGAKPPNSPAWRQ